MKKDLLIISYNRPEKLKKVLNNIHHNYVRNIYFYNNSFLHENEKYKIEKCRKLILKYKFNGKSYYLFNKKHLDVKSSILKAIDWFFDNTKEGIILEDDILPTKSFYFFCSKLLDKYRINKKIFHISGFNHLEKIDSKYSYHFNYITHVWGWATWSDRWREFRKPHKLKKNLFNNDIFFLNEDLNKYRNYLYQRTLQNKIITWDYLWDRFIRINNGFNIRPNLNLVKNIGFDFKATNTKFAKSGIKTIKTFNLNKINHPKLIYYNSDNDNKYFKLYEEKNLTLKKNYDYIRDIFKEII